MNDSRPFHVFLRCAPCCVLAPPVFSCFYNYKSRVPQAPKRQAVGSPKVGNINAGDPDYAPITLTQSETDDEM